MSNRWLVAGTSGGVGTTTLTALLFAACRERFTAAPQLLDHTAGTLGARLSDGDDVRALDPHLTLHDFGPHAGAAAIRQLSDPTTTVIVVGGATPVGAELTVATLRAIDDQFGSDGLQRTVVVAAQTFGRHRVTPVLSRLRSVPGVRGVQLLPADPALAAGGRIPLPRLSRRTHQATSSVLDLVWSDLGKRSDAGTDRNS